MKQKTFTYIAFVLLLGLSSCKQEVAPISGMEDTPMTFTATGLNYSATQSRTTVNGDWEGVDKVAVMIGDVVKEYDVTPDAENNTIATLTSVDPFYWTSAVPQTVIAWWPYSAGQTEIPNVTVLADQSEDGFAQSDCIAVESQEVAIGATALNFVHRTARLTVTLEPGDTDNTIEGATVKFIDLSTVNNNPAIITSNNTNGAVYEALVAPQTIEQDKIFILTTLSDGSTYTYVPKTAIELEAGKRYNYTLSIKGNELELVGSTITDWSDEIQVDGSPDYILIENNTYIVYTARGLKVWADATTSNSATNCILADTIDMSGETWRPVCTDENPEKYYAGIFDGKNYPILNLSINGEQDMAVGFFGVIGPESEVRNLILTDISINGYGYAGSVAGYNSGGKITDCKSSGSVIGEIYAGGIVGVCQDGGFVTSCSSSVDVSGGLSGIGGVIGATLKDQTVNDVNKATISKCQFSGTVTNENTGAGAGVGGIVGTNTMGDIIDCYSGGTVNGVSTVGGVVGFNAGNESIKDVNNTITASYFDGKVSGTGDYIGGVVGSNGGIIIDCHLDRIVTDGTVTGGIVTGANSVGGIVGSNAGPLSNCDSKGVVTGSSTSTEEGSRYIGGVVGDHTTESLVNCTSSATVTGRQGVGGVAGRIASGSVSACGFTGSVEGEMAVGGIVGYNEVSLSNCDSKGVVTGTYTFTEDGQPSEDEGYIGGVVGYHGTESLVNCTSSATVTGGQYVGGVAGGVLGGQVSACYFTGSVEGKIGAAGGMVGQGLGTFTDCHTSGTVNGGLGVGGMFGMIGQCRITSCTSAANVTGTSKVGGLIGYGVSGVSCADCGASGIVKGNTEVGGVVGELLTSVISNCYFTGTVSGTEVSVGGVAGRNAGGVVACYAINSESEQGTVSGASEVGGVVGTNRGIVAGCYSTKAVTGTTDVGGVVGTNYGNDMVGCYSIGEVSGTTNVGGVVGRCTKSLENKDGSISSCYWEGDLTNGVGLKEVTIGDPQKIDSATVTWQAATTNMNSSLNLVTVVDWLWEYVQGSDVNTPPTLQKKS